MTDERSVYAVDFDNTLTQGDAKYWEGERPQPDEEMVEATNQLYFDRNTIIVWTARPWDQARQIAAHLTEWGVRWHGIKCNKGSAETYIDDKAINTEDFKDSRSSDRDGSESLADLFEE